ncbi:hypothetical protein ACNJX9_19000 [Bradyrhizobium sp. DASA03076]|uniref:Uncharacterized protein n=1 Tax=Bradyrhizobium manausense TaxID=989370 RepID=A0A0R3D1X4_9BRAD|nr:hypothetical protein [Bradyrhizobium manausense]KRQ03722.1 hypothetical protein AOQ71_34260 [Bradyrhizobium manausense]
MKKLFSIGAIAALLTIARASAAELPTFELAAFPITAHQVALIGGTKVEEQAPTPTLMLNGMSALPPSDRSLGSALQGDGGYNRCEAGISRIVSAIIQPDAFAGLIGFGRHPLRCCLLDLEDCTATLMRVPAKLRNPEIAQ